jgi:dTDP-D-glucose 4,6-dehydratase
MLCAMAISHGKIVLNSDGQALRPHLHILDVCQSIKCALEAEHLQKPIIANVGRDEDNLSILQLAELVSSLSENCPIEFLNRQENSNQEFSSLVADRKISNGVDARSYKVTFARIKKIFPTFACQWDLKKGITQTREKLLSIGFNRKEFENRAYYRLQTIEDLFSQGKINAELRWK